uniref:Uncharacterized protein n=1 Tax=Haptolina brevifila TaxID=156173 RepID=A0A7S2IN93_9EUKA|mmetsp:Transcript_68800/g.136370  ORF Transcript_68800/g.136370 Transcript_68800/m.136370 type:complete len:522 (+) Transcript_68800:1180-2745(+)
MLTMVQLHATNLLGYVATTDATNVVLMLCSSSLSRVLQLVTLLLSLGGTAIVFLTMTFYMLSSERDVLTLIVDKVHPAATQDALQRMRDTIDAIIVMPIAGAARNAMLTEFIYAVLGVRFRHLAALGVVIFTLFPLTYTWVVSVPWVLILLLVSGEWRTGVVLLALMVGSLSGHTASELRLQSQAGIGDYVHAFCIVLGVYVFGVQGVLFGPMIVCVAKLLTDIASELIRDAEGVITSPPAAPEEPTDAASAIPPPLHSRPSAASWPGSGGAPPASRMPSLIDRTMRRLSFLSSYKRQHTPSTPALGNGAHRSTNSFTHQPTAHPTGVKDSASQGAFPHWLAPTACNAAGLSAGFDGRYEMDGADAYGSAELQPPPPHLWPHELPCIVTVVVGLANDARGEEGSREKRVSVGALSGADDGEAVARPYRVRVTTSRQTRWDDFLTAVTERLVAVHRLSPGLRVSAIETAEGFLVGSTKDLREGEALGAHTLVITKGEGSTAHTAEEAVAKGLFFSPPSRAVS